MKHANKGRAYSASKSVDHQTITFYLQSALASGDIIRFITSGIFSEPVVNDSASVESPRLHPFLACCTLSCRFFDRVNSGINQTLRVVQDNLSAGPLSIFPFSAPSRRYAASETVIIVQYTGLDIASSHGHCLGASPRMHPPTSRVNLVVFLGMPRMP
ncbi:hypothetical protein BJV77DRAFT_493668 [Russula vinacea]|nr:hypothetical protein BJV77DRAFT_493668 [Russula vinacea]